MIALIPQNWFETANTIHIIKLRFSFCEDLVKDSSRLGYFN
jgi:hypothetical protein